MTREHYVLVGNEPRAVDLDTWLAWTAGLSFDAHRVALDEPAPGIEVSTVFLFGINHRYDDGPPLLFETIIFGGEHDEYQERYPTWDEAVAGHARAVAMVRASLGVAG